MGKRIKCIVLMLFVSQFLLLFLIPMVLAHDCTLDRPEDWLRTDGFAQGMSTAAAVIATVLVNGSAFTQVLISKGEQKSDRDSGLTDESENERKYFLEIASHNQRTAIASDGKDQLWIYGKVTCTDPEIETSGLTRSLEFTPGGPNAEWLQLGDMQMSGTHKAAAVKASPPGPDAGLASGGAFVRVGTMIEGKPVNGDVQLELITEYYLEFEQG